LKNVTLSSGMQTIRGEAIVTRDGIEGGAVYTLSPILRERINEAGSAALYVDLRPDMAMGDLASRLGAPRGKQSISNWLRKAAGLSPVAIGLLQEAAMAMGQKLGELPPAELAALIHAVPLALNGIAPIARAISSAGGIAFSELDDDYMIRKLPGVFAAGEMLDWEAPTGGYLLQASFATGAAAGRGALQWLKKNK
jgi:predicted flavoprotein YhiN